MKTKTIIYICLAAFLFATMEVALKVAGTTIDVLQMTYLRFLIAGLMIMPLASRERKKLNLYINKKQNNKLFILGGVYMPVSMICFQAGVVYCNAATASVLISFTPIFVTIFNCIRGRRRFAREQALMTIFGLAGMVFIIRPWDIQAGNTILGMVLLVVASFVFSLYTVLGEKTADEIGTMTMTSVSFIICAGTVLIIAIIVKRPIFVGTIENWWIIFFAGFLATGFGYLFYFLAIDNTDASTGAVTFFIKPAIAPVLAVIILGETIYWNTIAGIAALLLASYFNIYKGRKKK